MPLLLEKINSSIQSAKIDALQTLVRCCNPVLYDLNGVICFFLMQSACSDVYGPVALKPFLDSCSMAIEREVCTLYKQQMNDNLNTEFCA